MIVFENVNLKSNSVSPDKFISGGKNLPPFNRKEIESVYFEEKKNQPPHCGFHTNPFNDLDRVLK